MNTSDDPLLHFIRLYNRSMEFQASMQEAKDNPPSGNFTNFYEENKTDIYFPSEYFVPHLESASDQVKEERLTICRSCDQYNDKNKENPICNSCGCNLNIKTGFANESCPLKKWFAIKTQSNGGCGGCGKG